RGAGVLRVATGESSRERLELARFGGRPAAVRPRQAPPPAGRIGGLLNTSGFSARPQCAYRRLWWQPANARGCAVWWAFHARACNPLGLVGVDCSQPGKADVLTGGRFSSPAAVPWPARGARAAPGRRAAADKGRGT